LKWGVRIGRFLHFSKLGSGHSGALRVDNRNYYEALPAATHYENKWWDRRLDNNSKDKYIDRFEFDGGFKGFEQDKQDAIEVAHRYSQSLCTGKIQTFHNFLINSIVQSSSPRLYYDRFVNDVLTPQGKEAVLKNLVNKFANKSLTTSYSRDTLIKDILGYNTPEETKALAAEVMCYAVKDRNLYKPSWAEDNSLWVAG